MAETKDGLCWSCTEGYRGLINVLGSFGWEERDEDLNVLGTRVVHKSLDGMAQRDIAGRFPFSLSLGNTRFGIWLGRKCPNDEIDLR